MGKLFFGFLFIISLNCYGQKNQTVITGDISNFWKAYDQVLVTKDSLEQIRIIQTLYIDKGTEGLKGIMQARRYTAAEYSKAISQYPLYWKYIRKNTLKAGSYARKIEKGIDQLREIYPALRPAKIYFTIGAFRTSGTILDDKVLIGSEIAMADNKAPTGEFGRNLSHLSPYFTTNPLKGLTFLNVHEYIHTQQNTTLGNTLLSQAVLEGAAEFIATIALSTKSPNEQISYGKKNDERIKKAFVKEMFSNNFDNWIWNSPDNEFGIRDLAYYVGYAICESYYSTANDKQLAVKTMIELDYNNDEQLTRFVEGTRYFEKPLSVYKQQFENSRPTLTRIVPFENGNQDISAYTKMVTLFFSEPMSRKTADFDIGPLGDQNVMWLEKRIGFSGDGRSYSFEIKALQPGKRYQLLVTDAFQNSSGIPLKPYLIDVSTAK